MPNSSAVTHPESPTAPRAHTLLLDNGLQAVWDEDHRQPLVAIEVRIKGGLRAEGRYVGTGITHFIEHMLFKGTPTRPPGTIEQEVRRYGGTINAFTSLDSTGVSLFAESRHLKDALALVADILQHAVFEPAEFDKERAVIISEIQMNLDDPDRRIHQLFWSRHFLEHPYRHPILGYRPLLEQLTVQDLAAFYQAQYQPQHIVIACVGDVDGSAVTAAVRELFSAWPRGRGDPAQSGIPAEPPPASSRDASLELPIQSAYAILGFPSVRLADPDLYPLDVLASVIGQGRSSRLYETIIRQRKLAHEIGAWNSTPYDPGPFGISLRTDPELLDPAAGAVLEVLEAVRQDGITEAELRKAKRMVRADHLFSLQTIEARAGDLASSLMSTGDPEFSRRYVEGIERVTRQQVHAAARRYCDPAVMTTAIIRPAGAPAPAALEEEAPRPIAVSKTTLENGATVLLGADRTFPLAAVVVGFRGGVRVETEQTQGLSNLVAQLLIKGTARKTATDIARTVESLGARLEPFSGRDGFGLAMQMLAEDLPEGIALAHELVTQSAFPEEELGIQRTLIDKELRAQEDEIFHVGGQLLRRTLFQAHPYRFNPLGDRATIGQLTRAQCADFARRWLVPSNLVIAVFGEIEPPSVMRQVAQTFGAMPAHASAWPERLAEPPLDGIQHAARTMDREQAVLMLGFQGSTHAATDRYALDLLTAVLSGMAGRLFQSVREAHGLSYTLGAVHTPGWDPGSLMIYAATRPEAQERVRQVIDEQLALIVEQGVTDEEIEQAKRYLIGLHRMDLQQLVGLARRSVLDELYGVGFDRWNTYEQTIRAVTPSMVHEAAKRYLTVRQRAEIVVSPNGHRE